MANTNFEDLEEELSTFFRNKDIISTTDRGATTFTDTLTSTGETTFTLSNTTGVRNIRFVTVNGSTQTMYRDLTPSYVEGTITFTSSDVDDDVVVNYDTAPSDKVYGDLPREDIDRLNYPRLMIKVLSGVTEEFALGGESNITDYFITTQMWSTSIIGLRKGITSIRNNILNNKKNFYHSPFVTVLNMGGMHEDFSRGDKIYTRAVDLTARFVVERQ